MDFLWGSMRWGSGTLASRNCDWNTTVCSNGSPSTGSPRASFEPSSPIRKPSSRRAGKFRTRELCIFHLRCPEFPWLSSQRSLSLRYFGQFVRRFFGEFSAFSLCRWWLCILPVCLRFCVLARFWAGSRLSSLANMWLLAGVAFPRHFSTNLIDWGGSLGWGCGFRG